MVGAIEVTSHRSRADALQVGAFLLQHRTYIQYMAASQILASDSLPNASMFPGPFDRVEWQSVELLASRVVILVNL